MFTAAVPPILPLCLTIGLEIGVEHLKKKDIETVVMSKINTAGWTKIMCFDKTGTLTENRLIYAGFLMK